MPLRILHAIQTMNPASGGPVEGVRQLSALNLLRGHEVEAVTLDPPHSLWEEHSEIKVHALGSGAAGYGYSREYIPWLRKHAAEYDCVVVNGVWGFNAFGAWWALRGCGVPYMVFTHGMLDPWFKYRYPLKHIKKWLYWPWGLYPLLRDADAVFFTCNQERLLARQSFWLYDCNELVVKYGTSGIPDPGRDYRPAFLAENPALAGKRCFLFLGRVHPKKGPDLFIKAVAQLVRDGKWRPETMRVVMAGPADSAYAQSLVRLARKEGVEDQIHWTGMISGDVKWGAMQAAEAFVLPSHQENFGIAVAEALSAGIPVLIAHPVNIAPEIALDRAGLVETDTISGCRCLLERWLALDEGAKEAMRVQARRTFERRYTAREAAKDLVRNIYLILAARKVGASSKAVAPLAPGKADRATPQGLEP